MINPKLFPLVEPLVPDHQCPICRQIFFDPVMVCDEGHSFCRACIDRHKRSDDRCPACRSELLRRFPRNLLLRTQIHKLQVGCRHEGCDLKTTTLAMENHMKQCQFRKEKCKYCNQKIAARHMETHLETCRLQHRPVYCKQCWHTIAHCDLQDHRANRCPKRKVMCKWCSKTIEFRTWDQHHHTCPKRKILCIRCLDEVLQNGWERHVRAKRFEHERCTTSTFVWFLDPVDYDLPGNYSHYKIQRRMGFFNKSLGIDMTFERGESFYFFSFDGVEDYASGEPLRDWVPFAIEIRGRGELDGFVVSTFIEKNGATNCKFAQHQSIVNLEFSGRYWFEITLACPVVAAS